MLAEPAILVKQGEAGQSIWSLDKMDAKIVQMRELYSTTVGTTTNTWGTIETTDVEQPKDPFHEGTQHHDLVGVANLYMMPLFHNVKFMYSIPVISPQGEVAGRLKVLINFIFNSFTVKYTTTKLMIVCERC